MKLNIFITIVLTALLAGCGTLITNSTGPSVSPTSILGTDLVTAASNLDQAIAIGALPANDPADVCVHGVLQQVGLEAVPGAPAPASFQASNKGLVSGGSIVYIRVQQLKNLKTVGISDQCYALLGKLQVDGLKAAVVPLAILK